MDSENTVPFSNEWKVFEKTSCDLEDNHQHSLDQ